jgi:hypothetical protein
MSATLTMQLLTAFTTYETSFPFHHSSGDDGFAPGWRIERRFSRWKHEAVLEKVQDWLDHNPAAMAVSRQTAHLPEVRGCP